MQPEIDFSTSKYSEKGAQTFFYTAIRNHVDLGNLADKKANLLLTVNALIFSLMVSKLFFQFYSIESYLLYPLLIIVISSIITVILTVLVTRPSISSGIFNKEDFSNKKVNLAFFGNFYNMDLKEYEWATKEMLKDKDHIYLTLTQDLYFLGKVLNKKYLLLNASYLVFMLGIISAVLTAIVLLKFNG